MVPVLHEEEKTTNALSYVTFRQTKEGRISLIEKCDG